MQQGYDFGDYINPDDIAQSLTGLYEERVRQAQALADERRKDAIAAGRSFSFETVFSHPSKLDDLQAARAAGFAITLFFIAVDDPTVNIGRVRTRVALGGHDVPEDRIAARYPRTMSLLIEMVQRVDRAVIFDNTVQSDDPLAFRGGIVAECVANTNQIVVKLRASPPAWTLRYLVEPARRLGWIVHGFPVVRNRVSSAAETAARKTARSIERALRNTIETQPYTAVVIALGLGWLFGRMHRPR